MIYRNAIAFALKRLASHRWLALSQAIGLLVAVALAVAIPLYADGINYSVLNASLASSAGQTRRGPFDFVFRYIGSWYGDVSADQYRPIDAYLSEQATPAIGLPLSSLTRYAATANLQLYPASENLAPRDRLDLVKLAFLSGVFDHVQLIEGSLPQPADASGSPPQVLVSLDLANNLDLQVGQTYALYTPASGATPAYRQDVVISGIWTPANPDDDFWALYPADSFEKKLLAREDSWWSATAGLAAPLDEAAWRLALDGSRVSSSAVSGLLARIDATQNRANALLAHTDLETSPAPALRQYRQDTAALTGSLFAFSVPVLGLVLFFLALVAGLFVRSQRSEIAVLRSRGAPRTWILAVYFIEWSILGLAALVLGLPAGLGLAGLMGRTRSFLDFSNLVVFSPHLSFQEVWVGLLAVLLGIAFCLLPVWQSGRDTIISYKQERARARRAPSWQRFYLDFVCILPALYGLYTLRAQGRLAILGRAIGSADPYQNPLLFLLPALLITGLSLLVLRALPALLVGLAALAARLPGAVPVLVLRQFARSGSAYQGVLLLITLTLGLAAFASSMAASLDTTLSDGISYQVGADLNLAEGGEFISDTPVTADAPGGQASAADQSGLWNFIPVSDHLSLPGVQAAARVGQYNTSLNSGGRSASGQVLGIDRADFASVAFFRDDFAGEPLNALMNRLASSPDAVLVDAATWQRFNLNTGDTLDLLVTPSSGDPATISFTVAGAFTRFPTWNPDQDGALFVTNLDYLFETWGGLQPYAVWLRTAPNADTQAILDGINQMGVSVVRAQDARAEIDTALDLPGRQGVLGMLSVGFLASAGLTVLGFFLYALFSFRERFIQLGVLRAIGLSVEQMRSGLTAELACLTLTGILAGTLVGVLAARGFIPYLPVSSGAGADLLPHISRIAWGELALVYALFGVTLLAGAAGLVLSLRKMKIFQAIKLGETL
jgi:putative ABC transport system permease protein